MNKKIHEIIGWYGMVAIVSAYALNSFGIAFSGHILYQGLNLTGALAIAYISFKKKAYQPGVLNLIWSVIAAIALLGIIFATT